MKKERINEMWGVLFLLLGLFSLTSLLFFHPEDIPFFTSHPAIPVHNMTGVTGAYLAFFLLAAFGASALMIPGIFLLWSGCFFLQKVPEKKLFKFIGLAVALFSTSTLIAISIDPSVRLSKAGAVGYLAGNHLLQYFGYVGSFILASSCLLLSILLATDFLIYPLVKSVTAKFREFFSNLFEEIRAVRERFSVQTHAIQEQVEKVIRKKPKQAKAEPVPSSLSQIPLKVKQYRPDIEETPESKAVIPPVKEMREVKTKERVEVPAASASSEESRFEGVIASKKLGEGAYNFPSIDLLRRPPRETAKTDNLPEKSKLLEETLAEFGIEVKVVEVEQGPVITRYELMPAPGV
ncbi:MAG: DNA translocase FtsK 4TM domain-containing protein, partial [Candidatus Omnitrophica bacterium]|nr:DNA translocase FtsK 4TM domain-containing protein [Candidatus Omnitrophota bacterium]